MFLKTAMVFVFGLAAMGLGTPLISALGCSACAHAGHRIAIPGLAGLFVAASLAMVINFFVPIGIFVALLVLGLGLFLLVARPPHLSRRDWLVYLALVIAITPVAVLRSPGYDGGLYHLPHQHWMVTDKIVFGLANLHGRFGFNSLLEPFSALGWFGGDVTAVPLLAALFGLFFLALVVEGISWAKARGNTAIIYVMTIFWLGYLCVVLPMPDWIGWTSTDLPSAIVVSACIYCGFAAVLANDRNFLVLAFFFSGFAVALKLSGAFVALFPLLLALRLFLRGERDIPTGRILLAAALFLPWLFSNFIVSGCLAYPIGLTCVPVFWEASQSAMNDEAWIKAWARAPHTGLKHLVGWDWLPLWLANKNYALPTFAGLAAMGIVVAAAQPREHSKDREVLAATADFSIYAFAATGIWFLTAPDPRFALGHLASLAMLPGLWLIATGHAVGSVLPGRYLTVLVVALTLACSAAYAVRFGQDNEIAFFGYDRVAMPTIETRSAGSITRPTKGDQCFLVPPPCSPYPEAPQWRTGPYRGFFKR